MFLVFFSFMLALGAYINNRGPMWPSEQDLLAVKPSGFRYFNPSVATNSKGLVAKAWRYSKTCYCQDRVLPLRAQKDNESFIKLSVGHSSNLDLLRYSKILDTSAIGPGNYEDPRLLWLDDRFLFIIFSRSVPGPDGDHGTVCICIVDTIDALQEATARWLPLATREFTSSKTQKNWMAQKIGQNINLVAQLGSQLGSATAAGSSIVYQVAIDELVRSVHTIIEVPDCSSIEWRGSTCFATSSIGPIAIVHRRLPRSLAGRFMPEYEYALCLCIKNEFYLGPPFKLYDERGFVYVSGLEIKANDTLVLQAGVADCYESQIVLL